MTFPLISPPQNLAGEKLAQWNAASLIDYESHPAYAGLIRSATFADRMRALRRFFPTWLLIKAKRLIRYEMIPLHIRSNRPRLLAAALCNLFQRSKPHDTSTAASGLSPLDLAFRQQGCAVVAMPAADCDALEALSRPNFEMLTKRRAAAASGHVRDFEESRAYASRAEAKTLFDTIERIFTDAGVMDTATAYIGRNAKLIDVNPQINDASDDFWRRIFPDLGSPQPSCAYLHRDASGGDIKVIIYMSDVSPENGPFGYVVGSHRIALGKSDDHVAEANDSNGLAGTGPDNRRCFAALPARLRLKGAYGNDVPDESPLSQDLRQALWSITAPRGSIVMFDTKGTHRGGMVTAGERRVLTCVLG